MARTIDTELAVGAVDGTAGVSASGAANYQVPIEVPPGTNGMMPNLAVVYDMRSGDGILGHGWALSGLSVITRTGQTPYYDGPRTAVNFTAMDRFDLDGQRLLVTNGGTIGAAGTEYDTERAAFMRVRSNGQFGNGPESFSVLTKEGLSLEYGATTDSRILSGVDQHVLAWRLNRVQDAFGNYMLLSYEGDHLSNRISRIQYAGHTADPVVLPPITVEFEYETRADVNLRFLGANWTTGFTTLKGERELLKWISILNGGEHFKRYTFGYVLRDGGRSYLQEIGESGHDPRNVLNSTIITYGEETDYYYQHPAINLLSDFNYPIDFSAGDYNGNGRSDILAAPRYSACQMPYHTKFAAHFDGGSTASQVTVLSPNEPCTDAHAVWNPIDPAGALNWFSLAGAREATEAIISDMLGMIGGAGQGAQQGAAAPEQSGTFTRMSNSDFDGDGREELLDLKLPYVFGTQNFKFESFDIYRIGQTSSSVLFATTQASLPDPFYRYTTKPSSFMLTGDITGDGRTDVLGIFEEQFADVDGYRDHKLFLWSNGSWTELTYPAGNYLGFFRRADLITLLDVDGDGQLEIFGLNAFDGCSGYGQTGRTLRYASDGTLVYLGSSDVPIAACNSFAIYPGDFNGDGRTDLLTKQWDGTWRIQLSDGLRYLATMNGGVFDVDIPDGEDIRVADFDGDGLSDVGYTDHQAEGWDLFRLRYARGYDGTTVHFEQDVHAFEDGLQEISVCDADGDGRADLMVNTGFAPPKVFSFHPDSHERSIRKIRNGMGHITEFDYSWLTRSDVAPNYDWITGPNDFGFPMGIVIPPLEVVKRVTVPDGIGGAHQSTYQYQQAMVHKEGKGFLGFSSMTQHDLLTGMRSTTELAFNEPYATALPSESRTYHVPTAQLLTETETAAAPYAVANGRFYVRTTQQNSTDHLTGGATTQVVNSAWNACGLVETSQSIVANASVSFINTGYTAAGPSSVACRPASVITTTTRAGEPTVSTKKCYSYASTTGALSEQRDRCGQMDAEVTTRYSHDAFGHAISSSTSYAGLSPEDRRNKRWIYSSDGQHLIESGTYFNNNGSPYWATETFSDFNLYGTPRYKLGADGLADAWTFDDFGWMTEDKAPFVPGEPRHAVTADRRWDIANGHVYRERSVDPAAPDVQVWHDFLGREVKRCTEGLWGDQSCNTKTYDELGRVVQESSPHFSSEQFITTTNTYDALGRLETTHNDLSEKTTTYSYTDANAQRTVTVSRETNGAAQVSSRTMDATGKDVSATDDGGTLAYRYDSWGNLRNVGRNGTTVISSTFDLYGRCATKTDLDAGTTQFKYDPFDQVIRQTDPREYQTDLTYDNLGRLKTKVGQEGAFAYTYYLVDGRFLDVPERIDGGNCSYRYHYDDELLRLTATTKTIDGEEFVTGYGYDDVDRLSTTTYPSDIAVERTYTDNGGLMEVISDGEILFDAHDANGLGQYTGYGLSDGNTMEVTYDRGLPKHYLASGGLTTAQDLYMAYDLATGNVLNRQDALAQRRESFTYDDLNRLTGATVHQLDPNGNVIATVSTNTYAYDGAVGHTKGNLVTKSDVGLFGYSGSGSKLTAAYNPTFPTPPNAPPLVISQHQQDILYTPFSKVQVISEEVGGQDMLLSYRYDPLQQRCSARLLADGNEVMRRWYVGDYEKQVVDVDGNPETHEVHYIQGGTAFAR